MNAHKVTNYVEEMIIGTSLAGLLTLGALGKGTGLLGGGHQ
jgi:predicted alpha/beta superfamily hydrolase